MGGGCNAEVFASLIHAKVVLASATMAPADSLLPRSLQFFKVTKACAVF